MTTEFSAQRAFRDIRGPWRKRERALKRALRRGRFSPARKALVSLAGVLGPGHPVVLGYAVRVGALFDAARRRRERPANEAVVTGTRAE
jgi:hypothetical protein